ncbi:hypothetical protein [Asaia bogorensis]|uniref:hypothetical protein n=1 Tax=Asaia bogorensis TaxID=91915 RepID=UPI000781DCAA|nr:hypothetical protein [Asaia bogorensis]
MSLNPPSSPATPKQGILDLGIEIERVIAGIEMGVLENGTPYLTQRGLAGMSGAARSTLQELTLEWETAHQTGIFGSKRVSWFKDYLAEKAYGEPSLYIEIRKDGSAHYAYPDVVCMAVIEYFAFEAQRTNETALKSFRQLARFGLQSFIYEALGYAPPDKWKYYHDRVSLLVGGAPDGYFIVFNEVGGMIVDLINADVGVNDKTIPDISVGKAWGSYWTKNNLENTYGPRVVFEHNYPSYYPQAASNPQRPWAYPNEALAEFRRWFRHEYLTTRFPKYILTKAHLIGGQEEAKRIGQIYQPRALSGP